jgi:hypothetical protein
MSAADLIRAEIERLRAAGKTAEAESLAIDLAMLEEPVSTRIRIAPDLRDRMLADVDAAFQAREDAETAYRDALLAAADAGVSGYALAKRVGRSPQSVQTMIRNLRAERNEQ